MTGLIEWSHKNIKFNYLIYPVDKKNFASRKIPEKNGGKLWKKKRQKVWLAMSWMNMYIGYIQKK